MIPIDQTHMSQGDGDCMRAVVASLLHLKREQVPHFRLYRDNWHRIFYYFMFANGWEYEGNATPARSILCLEDSINDLFYATVSSRTYDNTNHAVIINLLGEVIHDPNPNRKWLGEQIFPESIKGWFMFSKLDGGE